MQRVRRCDQQAHGKRFIITQARNGDGVSASDMPGVDQLGRSALHYAACDGDVDAVKRLIDAGSDVNVTDANGWTPLHFAAQSGHGKIAASLLAAGADPNRQDCFGNSPLFRATFESRGDGTLIRLLREAGADPLLKNKSGLSAALLARTIANYDVAQLFADVQP